MSNNSTPNNHKRNLWLVILLVLILLGAVLGLVWVFAKRPLARPLNIQVATNTPAPVIAITPLPATVTSPVPPTATTETTCGSSGSIVILMLARDRENWDPPHNADFIRYVQVDFSHKKVDVVAIPRDLWVLTPGLKSDGYAAYLIGELYYYVQQHSTGNQKDVAVKATTFMAQTLYDNFAVVPNNYITVDGHAIVKMIDTVGGVDINNPAQFTSGKYLYPAGVIHLDGLQAEMYMRELSQYMENANRLERQEIVIRALWAKIQDPANLVNLPGWINQYMDSFVTDLSPERISTLICMLDKVSKENLTFHDITFETTPDLVSLGPNHTLIPNEPRITEYLRNILSP